MGTFRELNRSARNEARRTLSMPDDEAHGPGQRQQFYAKAVAEVRASEAIRRQSVEGATAAEKSLDQADFPHDFVPVALEGIAIRHAVSWAFKVAWCLIGAAVLVIVWCAIAFAAPDWRGPIVIGHTRADHEGGDVDAFAARYAAIRASGRPVEIDGLCVSACTIVASLPAAQVCVTPRAVLGVHLASDADNRPDPAYTDWAVGRYYPPALQEWIHSHGGLTEWPKWVRYRDLLAIFPACKPSHRWHWTGHPSDPALHAWFDSLQSGKGLCCSFADGVSVADVDWDTGGPNNSYRVRLDGQWIVVPPDAVVTVPNKYGRAVVWPYQAGGDKTQIRCFLPGVEM